MLFAVILLGITSVLVTSENIPCRTGRKKCKNSDSLTVVNGKFYCCGNLFNLLVMNQEKGDRALSKCVCYKETDDIDCLDGHAECKYATGYIVNGNTIKCCNSGYGIDSFSKTVFNGVKLEYCKCTRYINNGGVSRPLKEGERVQAEKFMKLIHHQTQTSLQNLRQVLDKTLRSIKHLASHSQQGLTKD